MKKTDSYGSGTSYHGVSIETKPATLKEVAKKLDASYSSQNTGSDKTNYDFVFETDEGHVFTVYDWKYYRPLKDNEVYEFHIGAVNQKICFDGKREILDLIAQLD